MTKVKELVRVGTRFKVNKKGKLKKMSKHAIKKEEKNNLFKVGTRIKL